MARSFEKNLEKDKISEKLSSIRIKRIEGKIEKDES